MSAFWLYVLGFFVLLGGLAYGAFLLNVPDNWIGVGALVLLGDVAYLGKLLRKRAGELASIATPVEAASLVELAWWLEKEVRDEIVTAGFRDGRQAVKAAARRVVESGTA